MFALMLAMHCCVCYVVGMHIHIVPNRGSRPTILLRESYREGKKVKKRTIANLSHLPMPQIELLRAVFQGVKSHPKGATDSRLNGATAKWPFPGFGWVRFTGFLAS